MKEKKNSSEWYIAATHWLTAMVSSVIFGAIIIFLLAMITQNPMVVLVGMIVLNPVVMWFAVKYSARYLDKTYVIRDASNIVLLSTIYLVIVAGGYRAYHFVNTGVFQNEYIAFILALIVFYIASKKYIKSNVA